MGKRKTYMFKNNTSLRYEISKQEEKLQGKYKSAKEYQKYAQDIVNNISPNRLITLDGEEKAKYYIAEKKYDNLNKKITPRELNSVDDLYNELGNGLFKQVISEKNQTGQDLINKTIQLNYSNNPANANMSYLSVKDSIKNIMDSEQIVAYDLETYGGTSPDGIWRPQGITEFSFQTHNKSTGKIDKNTAAMGINKRTAENLKEKVLQAIKDGNGTIADESLRVTAMRMQMYGMSDIEHLSTGISRVRNFPGDEAMIGGYDTGLIEKGFNYMVDIYEHGNANKTDGGLLSYHNKFFNQIASISNNKTPIIDFNGMQFDLPIINSQIQKIMRSDYGYGTDKANVSALNEIFGMFGMDGQDNWDISKIGLNPKANQRLDLSGLFRNASAIKGTEYMYGSQAENMLSRIGLTKLNRQEHIAEAAFPDYMKTAMRHEAESDVTTLIKLALEKSETYGGKSAVEHAMSALDGHFANNSNLLTAINSTNMAEKIFMAKKGGLAPGRGVLNFSVDNNDKSIRTATNYMIGNPNEYMETMGGVANLGWNTSANLKQGKLYQVGGIYNINPTDELLSKLTNTMPEYASNELIAVKVNSYLGKHKDKYKDLDTSHYFFFTEQAQAEEFLSNSLDYIASNKDGKIKYMNEAKDKLTLGTVTKDGIKYNKSDDSVNDYIDYIGNKITTERSNSHFNRDARKQLDKFNALIKDMGDRGMLEVTKDKGAFMHTLKVAKNTADKISQNGVLRPESLKDALGFDLINSLGYTDSSTGKANLYTNTLNNFINNAEKFYDLHEGMGGLSKYVSEDLGLKGEAASMKYAAMLNELKLQHAENLYGKDFLANNKYHKQVTMSKHELKNTFEVDVRNFANARNNKHLTYSLESTIDDSDVLKINLKSPHSLVKDVTRLKFGERNLTEVNKHQAAAMVDFVDYLHKSNPKLAAESKRLKGLLDNIEKNNYSSSTYIAEELIAGLKEVKANNMKFGIRRDALGVAELLDDESFRTSFAKSGFTKEAFAKANKSTADYATFSRDALWNSNSKGSPLYLQNIVDEWFMPSIVRDGQKLTGSNALDRIRQESNFGTGRDKYFSLMWEKTRNSHLENVGKIHNLIDKTGGQMVVVDGMIAAKHGDKTVLFEDLVKTEFNYGALQHRVGSSYVNAHMNLSAVKTNGSVGFDLESNLHELTPKIKSQSYMLERAMKEGKFRVEDIDLFRGSISNEMRKDSIISTNNVHELSGQWKIGFGNAIGSVLEQLVGVDGKKGDFSGVDTIDKDALLIIRQELEKLKGNYSGTFSPQMKEALGKNLIPMLRSYKGTDATTKQMLEYISASSKDTDIGGKDAMYFFFGDDRYTQRANDPFDNPQRPVLQAGKIDYRESDLHDGLESYKNITNKSGKVGSIFENINDHRRMVDEGVGVVDSAITIKKANVGNIGLQSIIQNHFKKVTSENTVEKNIKMNKNTASKLLTKILDSVNLQEQEKIMDSRLMDTVFEKSADFQFISKKDLATYYGENLNVDKLSFLMAKGTPAEKQMAKQELGVLKTLSDISLDFNVADDGYISVKSNDGKLVRRGDKLMSYYDAFNPEGSVSSKIHLGRFEHAVYSKKGNIKLQDSEIEEFLNANIVGATSDNIKARALRLLEDNFKVGYSVSDVRQQTYSKFMNDMVEKDMTYGLYQGLGAQDTRISKVLKAHEYQGMNMSILENQVLKASEIDKIFGGVSKEALNEAGFKNYSSFKQAIETERHALSKVLFSDIDELKDVSVLANHQVGKHNNQGMIADNIIGSMFDAIDKSKSSSKEAMQDLVGVLQKNKVFNDNMEVAYDGRTILLKPKDGGYYTKYDFTSETPLSDVRTLNIEGLKQAIKTDDRFKHLYNKNATFIANGQLNSMEAFGELSYYKQTYKDINGKEKTANVAFSKGMSVLQQSVDPETMTTYDYRVVQGETLKRNAIKQKIDADLKWQNREANGMTLNEYENLLDKASMLQLEAQNLIGGLDAYAKPKTIGRQEMRIYDSKKWNYAVENTVQSFLNGGEEEFLNAREKFVKNAFNGVLDSDGKLTDDYRGQKVFGQYTKDVVKQTIFDGKKDIELTEEMLTLDRYKHLGSIYSSVKQTAQQAFGDDAKVGLDYAEKFYQATSAHQSALFNNSTGNVSIDQMEKLGFNRTSLRDFSHLGKDLDEVSSLGSVASRLDLNTIYNSNNLIYLGNEFGGINNPNAYLAMPKAGKLMQDAEVNEIFQTEFKSLQRLYDDFYDGKYAKGTEDYNKLIDNISSKVKGIKTNIENYAYSKEGAFHELGKTKIEESFRLKFSFMNNAHLADDYNDNVIQSEMISKGDSVLKRAKFNGQSLYDLEKNGVYMDYAFVSNDIFERLGYYENEKLATLGVKTKNGVSILDANGSERLLDFNNKEDLSEARGLMKEHLKTNGIVASTGRYPMIMEDSEKATRIYLDDGITDNNRARVSVATALSMNADNDGDSASFGVMRLANGKTYHDYQSAKIQAERRLIGEGIDISSEDGIGKINEIVSNRIGADESKFFRGLDAHMGYNAIGINTFYHEKSMDDIKSEIQKSITNGSVTEYMENLKHENIYKGMLYANNGANPSNDIMKANADRLDSFVSKVNALDETYKIGGGKLSSLTKIDIQGHGSDSGIDMAEYYDKYLSPLNKISGLINRSDDKALMNDFGINSSDLSDFKKTFTNDFSEENIERFRQQAVARSRWFDSFKETQSKSRKGSIGAVNVGLQGIRAAGDVIYGGDSPLIPGLSSDEAFKRYNISSQVAYELEEEVIGAKHGNLVNNITKARDISSLTNSYIYKSNIAEQGKAATAQDILNWMNGDSNGSVANIGDKAINNIFKKLESDGRISVNDLEGYDGKNAMQAKRNYITGQYINALTDIRDSSDALDAMSLNRIGGNNGQSKHINNVMREINNMDKFNAAALNSTTYADVMSREASMEMADSANLTIRGVSQAAVQNAGKISGSISGFRGGGLAMGALAVAAGVMASGFAGSPVSQDGATELARQEDAQSSEGNVVPTLMDSGATVTQNSNRGYIINVKANSDKDMKHTRRAMRTAAAASAGGGVNVNMTIKDTRNRFTNEDFEQWVTGL